MVDLIGPGRQTVLPPSIHPDSGAPYVWTGTETLEDVAPEELPELTPDIIDKVSAVLAPFACVLDEPAEARAKARAGDEDKPHRQLNDAALANLAAWVPALGLCRCRRTRRVGRGGYEAVPLWRPSSTGRPTAKRHLNLKIDPAGIRDFGGDRGFTPLDLVMAARGCDLESAWRFLSEHLGWSEEMLVETVKTGTPVEGVAAVKAAEAGPVEAGPTEAGPLETDPLEPFTRVPGVVGELVDWITPAGPTGCSPWALRSPSSAR